MNVSQTPRVPLFYVSEENFEPDDIEDICFDIKDKGYQVEISYHTGNVSDRDIQKLIQLKGLEDVFAEFSHVPTYDSVMQMRYMGIDPQYGHRDRRWIHEKSFVRESVSFKITNKQEFTSIEKKFADGKIADYTKDIFNYEMITSSKIVDCQVELDDDIQEVIDRCTGLFESDDVEVRGWGKGVVITFIKFREILTREWTAK